MTIHQSDGVYIKDILVRRPKTEVGRKPETRPQAAAQGFTTAGVYNPTPGLLKVLTYDDRYRPFTLQNVPEPRISCLSSAFPIVNYNCHPS